MSLELLGCLALALAVLVLFNRHVAARTLSADRRGPWNATDEGFTPTVTVVIPMFNEGAGVVQTLRSVVDSDYPPDRLEVVCLDDCSADDTHDHALAFARRAGGRVTVVRNRRNVGKRRSIIDAVRRSSAEIIVSVDSDVIIDPDAIRRLVRRFTSPRIGAVGGWVDVRNKHDNWLTRMQTVQYWYAYFVMRDLERAIGRVLCLSGCLTAYRRSVLLELEPVLEGRAILGVPIKHGEDRFLARQIVKAGYHTTLALDARCRTYVPRTLATYLSQQLRWRRSNIVDCLGGLSHVWRLDPRIGINYFAMLVVIFGYPVAVSALLAVGWLFPAILLHLAALALFGLHYRYRVRQFPPADRVGALSFVPQAVMMPISYGLLIPLAMLTLDSGSWETRGGPRWFFVTRPRRP